MFFQKNGLADSSWRIENCCSSQEKDESGQGVEGGNEETKKMKKRGKSRERTTFVVYVEGTIRFNSIPGPPPPPVPTLFDLERAVRIAAR